MVKLAKGKLYRANALNKEGDKFPSLIVYCAETKTMRDINMKGSYNFMVLDSEYTVLEFNLGTKMKALRVLYGDKIVYLFGSHVRFNNFSLIK